MLEHAGEVDRGRVTTDADSVERTRRERGDNNHEAQRDGREAPDQTQGQFSAFDANLVCKAGKYMRFQAGRTWFGASR
ncbi:hypothetical protein S23_10730 [Bradyrhizobium cosmicum]|uniref:Uncharacterized protein n=1 Tax=Bradyrhizobium cosmicum TaxID=1404864 RepID=A0AAI8MA22_9BRAD|nr:hypothetical protein S23_10730 [Bradyrhizobium cosmicum]